MKCRFSCVRELNARGGNLPREGGGWILGSAMPSRTVKKVKRAGKRAIDRVPSHERMALFRAILCVAVYFVFCGSRQCRTSRTQRYPHVQMSFPLRWHVTFARATQRNDRVYCISRYIPVTDYALRFSYLACPRDCMKYFSSFLSSFYASSSPLFLSRFTEPKIEINNANTNTISYERIFDISRLMRRGLSFVCLIINSHNYLETVIA